MIKETHHEHRTWNVITFMVATCLAVFGFAGQLFIEADTSDIGGTPFRVVCMVAAVILYIQGFVVEAKAIRETKRKFRQMKDEPEIKE